MNANRNTKRAAALGLSALILSSVMLCSVACTRDDHKNPGDTTAGGNQTTTTPATGDGSGSGSGSDKPLDPDAGTVKPDDDAGDPPAGTEGENGSSENGSSESGTKDSRGILPRFMH